MDQALLKKQLLKTPIGDMIAVGNDDYLFLLEFLQRKGLEKELSSLEKNYTIEEGEAQSTCSIRKELDLYFSGSLKQFHTPVMLLGSPFQKEAWKALMKIPFGETRSYQEQAIAVGNPKAYRAVANANGRNQIAIVIPCHRIIQANGALGGYGGGIDKKQQLLEHEKSFQCHF